MINTDLELASLISKDIGTSYKEAVEFTTALPSYSLICYRNLLEGICDLIESESNLTYGPISLYEKINALGEGSVITFGFKDRCHRLRLLCNPGAHRRFSANEPRKKDDLQAEQEKLKKNAFEARDLSLWILESVHRSLRGYNGTFEYLRISIQTQELRDLLFEATVGGDAQTKFRAGLWCEAEAERRELDFNGIIAPTEFENDQNFLKRLAATFHLASYKTTGNIDAGFRYAQFVVQKTIDADKSDDARKLIEDAANAGHGEACDYHASILYDDENDYENAEKFWLLSAQRNVTRAYSCLYFYYTEGKACTPDPAKAVGLVEKGVEQGCRDCLYTLGRAYYEGEHVSKNLEKAQELLAQASDLGHGIARGYLLLVVNGGAEVIAEEFAKIGRLLQAMDKPQQAVKSIALDPYALCSCGSSKKYKWCCMNKSLVEKPARSALAQFLPPLLK